VSGVVLSCPLKHNGKKPREALTNEHILGEKVCLIVVMQIMLAVKTILLQSVATKLVKAHMGFMI
jgi:hypothetical protein